MLVDGVKKKSEQKSIIIGESEGGDGKKSLYPRKKYPSDDRIKIGIPKNTRLYDFVLGYEKRIKIAGDANIPAWKKLDELVGIVEQTREEWAERIFEEFIIRMGVFYPEKTEKLRKLRQLIIWQILDGEELADAYYTSLKTLR